MNNSCSTKPTTHCHLHALCGVPSWVHAFAWGVLVVVIVFLLGICHVYRGQNVWGGWKESYELRNPVYAERVSVQDVFRTEVNTWSNLAFVMVGLYAVAIGWNDWRRKWPPEAGYVRQTPAMSLLFGASCCFLGLGSGIFHASLTRWGQQLDVSAMYSPLVVIIALNWGRWYPYTTIGSRIQRVPTWPLLAALSLCASFMLYKYKWSMSSRVVLPTLVLTVSALTLLDRFQAQRKLAFRWLVLATVSLVLAALCRQLDVARRFSDADSWIQGHALWHILTSCSLACIYLYHRSEVSISRHMAAGRSMSGATQTNETSAKI